MSQGNGRMPEGWARVELGEIACPSGDKVEPQDFPGAAYVSLEHIAAGERRILGYGTGSDVGSTKALFRAGDVLYGRLRPYLNKVAIPNFDGICSTDILVFPEGPAVDNRFLLYWLSRPLVAEYATRNANGINLPRISYGKLAELEIRLPPLPEQRRIVARIEELQARTRRAREALESVPTLLEQFRQSVLASAFRGDLTADWRERHPDVEPASVLLERIRAERRRRWEAAELEKMRAKGKEPKDERWKDKYKEPEPVDASGLPELPEGWEWANIGQLFRVEIGATPGRSQPEYWGGPIPWVSSGEVAFCRIASTRETITQAGLDGSSTRIHPAGTVLIGMIGEGRTRGQAAILDVPATNNQNAAAIVVPETEIAPGFVYQFLVLGYRKTRSIGSGNNQPALNKARVQAIPIPVPPLAEQELLLTRTLQMLDAAETAGSMAAEGRGTLDDFDRSLLARAFRGELVPQDPNDEPASVLLERVREGHAQASRPRRRS